MLPLHVPNLMPGYAVGHQTFNPGQGGPASLGLSNVLPLLPSVHPAFTGHISGLVQGPQFATARPQMSVNNNLATPDVYTIIPGVMKQPGGYN